MKKVSFFKSNYNDFIVSFDDITGNDMASLVMEEVTYYGQFTKSPLENRFISKFSYVPVTDETQKPYKAHWMVHDSKLFLGYVNGVIYKKRMYTSDLIPEFPDNELLFHYQDFSGVLTLIINQIDVLKPANFEKYNCEILQLEFIDGNLLRINKQ